MKWLLIKKEEEVDLEEEILEQKNIFRDEDNNKGIFKMNQGYKSIQLTKLSKFKMNKSKFMISNYSIKITKIKVKRIFQN